ncbi:MAG: hypothetical protein ACRC2Q_00685, partial [Cetobacterium sp.]
IDFKNINFKESFKKNFFTLLIISILLESKVSKKHIVSYSKIITYLRQIVTSTDNIIDNEDKGLIFIKSLKNKMVSNSLIMLICQNFLTKECLELNEGKDIAVKKIFDKIYLIAMSESLRDKSQYLEYPNEKYILEKIHSGIGGELLKISLEAPLVIEENSKLREYSNGIFEIGMALQALDDFFDIEEDEESGKINLLKSALLYSEKGEEVVREEYLKKVSENAYNGFKILEDNEFPINKKEAKKVLKKLFELRGLKEYVSILD